jgi:glycosyltransferase involved in cell wall biosynthesis
MRVAIYTIALNEENYVDSWVAANKDADYLVVADTGSTDNTVEKLMSKNVLVHTIAIKPWRFDDARNAALSLIPADADVCISVDMDESMVGNWRVNLEQAWVEGTTRLNYTYNHSLDADGNPISSFMADKAHSRFGYRWQRPVHETVFPTGVEQSVYAPNVVMNHNQDTTKSRQSYLPLLIQSHKDMPNDSQTLFWLAREFFSYNKSDEAIEHFKKYLAMPESQWPDERSEAMNYLSKLMPHEKIKWLRLACAEAPYRREVWANLAEHYHSQCDWINLYASSKEGLKISNRCNNYLDYPHVWRGHMWDLAGIAAWNLNLKSESLVLFNHAMSYDPNEERIKSNYEFVKNELSQ